MAAPRQTLDQQRAAFAWNVAVTGVQKHGEKYRNLAKGAPALVMSSGLMPTLAFLQGKREDAHALLLADLCRWLCERFSRDAEKPGSSDYSSVMDWLHRGPSDRYMAATHEALAVLKWIRQYADAVPNANRGAT